MVQSVNTTYYNEMNVLNPVSPSGTPFNTMNTNGYYINGIQAINSAGQSVGGSINTQYLTTINVKQPPYSAVGNGTTDDTAAIQAAIAACIAAGGGTVDFPVGTYIVSSPLLVNASGVRLRGVSDTASIIKTNSSSTGTLMVGSQSISGSGKSVGCTIEELGFQCPATSTATNVLVLGATRFLSRRCDIFRGAITCQIRNADMMRLEDNNFRVTQSGAIALSLIEGLVDDVTTAAILGGIIDLAGINQTGIVFDNGDLATFSPNEFNNIFIGNAMKIDGNSNAGNTGVRLVAGVRNTLFGNVEFKNILGYGIDGVTTLLGGQHVFFTIDNCKMLGLSSSLAHLFLCQPSASGSSTWVIVRGAGTQMHVNTTTILVDSGSPHIEVYECDVVTTTNFLEITVGATPIYSIGCATLSSSVTNHRGTNLLAGTATYEAIQGNRFGNFALTAQGSATIALASTSIAVTTALDFAPTARDITIQPNSSAGGDTGKLWITGVSATGFTVNVTTAPTGSAATYQWKIRAS